ncbi:MAG TPA: hypothetical protein VIG04_00165 [Gemmatimonadales bacterium]|jgi:hypothetical protein
MKRAVDTAAVDTAAVDSEAERYRLYRPSLAKGDEATARFIYYISRVTL